MRHDVHRSMNDLDFRQKTSSSGVMAGQESLPGVSDGYRDCDHARDERSRTSSRSPMPSYESHSDNLGKLYHESLPGGVTEKALSHSGPPALVQPSAINRFERNPTSTNLGDASRHQHHIDETSRVISFTSSVHSLNYDSASVASSSAGVGQKPRPRGRGNYEMYNPSEGARSLAEMFGM